jgi:hypothetical protein
VIVFVPELVLGALEFDFVVFLERIHLIFEFVHRDSRLFVPFLSFVEFVIDTI